MDTLEGLNFQKKGNSAIVLDTRRGVTKTKYVGLIHRKSFSHGYTICPLVKRGLIFRTSIPKRFKTVHSAEQWLLNHAVAWDPKRKYTPLNFLIQYILTQESLEAHIGILLLQIIITQFILAIGLGGISLVVKNPVLKIGLFTLSVIFILTTIFNTAILVRNNL